jgi:hypothetical protein
VCARSRLTGEVHEFRFHRSSAIFDVLGWEYKREKLAEKSASRCTCRVVDADRCRLCEKSVANGPAWPEDGEPEEAAPAHLYA